MVHYDAGVCTFGVHLLLSVAGPTGRDAGLLKVAVLRLDFLHKQRSADLFRVLSRSTPSARSAAVVQDDGFKATESITVCPLATTTADIPLLRIPLQPIQINGPDDSVERHARQDRHGASL